jgi:hypothetical protein
MADPPAKKKNFFQKVAAVAKDFVEWVEETFGDPELAAEIKDDLGLDGSNPATPTPLPDATKARIETFAAKQDIDEAALLAVVADLKATFDVVMDFVDTVKADGVDSRTLFWGMFRVFALDVLRVRNPAMYALAQLVGLVTEDDETLGQLDAAMLTKLVRGEGTAADGEKWVQRLSMLGGIGVVLTVNSWAKLGGVVDTIYGWDPDPEDEGEAAVIASRALTVVLDADVLGGVRPALTFIGVPAAHGGPNLFVSATTGFQFPTTIGHTTVTLELSGAGQLSTLLWPPHPSDTSNPPTLRISAEPAAGDNQPTDAPALIIGTTDASRLQIGALAYGFEVIGDDAAFRIGVKKGKLVVNLGKGDSFLRQLPGGNVEVPFEIAMVADPQNGVRFEGGDGVKVNVPVSASLFGVFTVQFLELELKFEPALELIVVGGFSLRLGPFQASIDRVGTALEFSALSDGPDKVTDLVKFAPPKGIGLVLDAGVVKGGGYLFIDSERGEYAGALELKFLTFSIKAIGLLSTKRPDGSEGWSLLLFVFGQFSVHIVFGIFWTGLGGMLGLHHRSDVDALTAGMKTGALDDILFPANPVADAPRIINRYRTLFPVEPGNFLIGPMLELSFSEPPIVYVRIGLIFDVRNALAGGNGPMALSKVVLVGQVLVQLPPKATGAPATLKLLVDVAGFYDNDTQFLLIRARLRDSFVGVEHFAKLNLSGEFLLAIQFGSDPSLVISAGGFHPKFQDLPERLPRDLDRLKVSFGIGRVKLAVEHYFAVTPNSVQAGQKASLTADFGVAGIEASLGWDALLYLSPRFYFVIDVEFKAKVKAFGETLAAVGVRATLEGPDLWHVKGEFSFSILWWDKTVPFEESWGEIEDADSGMASLKDALVAELSNPDNLAPEMPAAGSPISLAPATGNDKVAHPLGRLAIRQRVVPFELQIDRLGTKNLAGGPTTVAIATVALNTNELDEFESSTESFAKGQFTHLSDQDRLTGKTFETFRCGVVVGKTDFVADDGRARDVQAGFETVRLDPVPKGVIFTWATSRLGFRVASHDSMVEASKLGAAARCERARSARRMSSDLSANPVTVSDPPMVLVGAGTLQESASLTGQAASTPTLAAQQAANAGQKVIEQFELVDE